MKPRLTVHSRLTIVALTLVCLIVPFCLGYMFFVTSQRSYYTKRNFRVLDGIATQIRLKIDNLTTNLINAASKAKEDTKPRTKSPTQARLNLEVLRKAVHQVNRYGTNLKLESESPTGWPQKSPAQQGPPEASSKPQSNPPAEPRSKPTAVTDSVPKPTAAPPPKASAAKSEPAKEKKIEPSVTMTVKPEKSSFSLLLEYRNGGQTNGQGAIRATSDVDKVITPLVRRYLYDESNQSNENLFDEVLVAEQSDGRVIFTGGESGIRLVNINNLSPSAAGDKGPRLSDGSSSVVDVELAGKSYQVFLQPLQLSIPSGADTVNSGVRWVVCGLVSSSHLTDETFAISYTIVISFFFLLVMALLGVPFLKLRLMGARDRLTRANLWSIALSAVLGTALFTFLLVDSYTYLALSWRLDDQLKELAGNIRYNFRTEVISALQQLTQLNEKLIDTSHKGDAPPALIDLKNSIGRTDVAEPGKKAGSVSYYPKTSILGTEVDCLAAPYPFFNSTVWVEPSGQQRIKWTTRSDTSPFIRVEDRLYFRNTSSDNLWSITDRTNPQSPFEYRYFLEPVNSRNTGENVTIISTRVPGSKWIMIMDTKLLSLVQTVLPAGYGYAVIDGDGNVLFHSQEVKNLEEQFFEECGNDGLLRSAVLSRTGELIDTKYLGRGHRLHVTPVPDTPWSLVVFRDKQMLRTMNLEILTLSFLLFLAFGALMLLLIMLLRWVRPGKRNEWLWPDEARGPRYWAVLLINLLLGLFYLPWLVLGQGWILILVSVLIPAAGIVSFTSLAGSGTGKSIHRLVDRLGLVRLPSSVGYTMSLTTLLILISVLPTLAYFKTARDFELTQLIRHGQMSVAKQLEARYDRVNQQYSATKIGAQDEQKETFLARRLGAVNKPNSDVYCSFFFKTGQTAIPGGQVDGEKVTASLQWLTWLTPLYNQTSIERHELSQTASSDDTWISGGDAYTGMSLLKRREGNASQQAIMVSSTLARFEDTGSGVWWGLMLAYTVLILGLAYLAVWFVGKRVFLVGFARPRAVPDHNLSSEPIDRNLVLIGSPLADGLHQWDARTYHRIDMVEVVANGNVKPPDESLKPELAIVLDHFEFNMHDPAANSVKLDLLEHFLAQGRTMVVLSATSPADFTLAEQTGNGAAAQGSGEPPAGAFEGEDGQPEDNANGAESDRGQRWADAFQTFTEVYQGEAESGPPMDETEKRFYSTLKCHHRLAYLERIRKEIRSDFGADGLSGDELVKEVADRSRPFHHSIWVNCSRDQKLTLIHVALNGLVSFHNNGLRSLMKSGLVVRDPALALMDEAFRTFVAARSREEAFWSWEKEGKHSYWELTKVPLGLVLITVAVFLFVTQKEFYDSTMTFLSAAAGGIAALLKLLGFFQTKQPSAGG